MEKSPKINLIKKLYKKDNFLTIKILDKLTDKHDKIISIYGFSDVMHEYNSQMIEVLIYKSENRIVTYLRDDDIKMSFEDYSTLDNASKSNLPLWVNTPKYLR